MHIALYTQLLAETILLLNELPTDSISVATLSLNLRNFALSLDLNQDVLAYSNLCRELILPDNQSQESPFRRVDIY